MSRTNFYETNYVGWPPVHVSEIANPNSHYWIERAGDAVAKYVKQFGQEAYTALFDGLPDDTTNQSAAVAIEALLQ
jgi:hypothetical protein